ncbi:MAG: MmcQ/YjbR family DNA-binding protein [Rhizomicrobium sp.]
MASLKARKPPRYAFVKRVALRLPGTQEVIDRHGFWFNIGKKTFALYGGKSGRWILRLPKHQVAMLAEAAPDIFAPMRAGALLWLYVDVEKLGAEEMRAYVTAAWRYTAPKKLQASIAMK